MLPADVLLTGSRVVLPEGEHAATLAISQGRIVAVHRHDDGPAPSDWWDDARRVDAGELVVLPGLVDSHVHVNEPGRTSWEGFATATRAAAAGGVTTIVDMPLNCLPPTTDVAALRAKREVAAPKSFVDVAFWGGAVPGNEDELAALLHAGVRGFKTFLCDSGVPEYGCVHPSDVGTLLKQIAALDTTLIVHAEDPELCDRAAAGVADGDADPRSHATWLATRPAAAEVAAVEALVAGVADTGARVHVLHVSAADAAEVVADAREQGLPLTAETCPHYLTLAAEDVPDGATEHKCAPPIRGAANAERLWGLLADDAIQAIVSDHSPCPPADKQPETGDFLAAWGGIASLQLGLPLIWTAARTRGHGLEAVARWMGAGPARIAGLDDVGALRVGARADLVLFDPDAMWHVDGEALEHRHAVTPHAGRRLVGRVVETWLDGVPVVEDGVPVGEPRGTLR